MSWNKLFLALTVSLTLLTAPLVHAASAPIGPPDPVAPVTEISIDLMITNGKDATGKNIGVRGQVDTVIANANANAAQQSSVRARISVESFTRYGAGMSATTYTDRPNYRYVRIPYMVGYKIYDVDKNTAVGWVATGITRHLSQSITIAISCDRWETGKGSLNLATAIDRPYMDNSQGTVEQVVDFFLNGYLTNFIDSQVRQQIAAVSIKNSAASLSLDCNALGATQVLNSPAFDVIRYSYHVLKPTPALAINSEVSLTLQSIKRLSAHDLQGQPLYAATETPKLEVFANQRSISLQLPALQEGQLVPVTANPIVLARAGLTNLSILVNVRQANGTQVDSATQVYGQNVNYGNGAQTIRVRKSYWTQANPRTGVKPQQNWVDAYELTFRINAPGDPLLSNPGMGTSPTPGTVQPGIVNPPLRAP